MYKKSYFNYNSYLIRLDETPINNKERLYIIIRMFLNNNNSYIQYKIIVINLFKYTSTNNNCKIVKKILKSKEF